MAAPSERAAAKLAGEKFYFTGRPCLHGHIAERETVSGACTVCRLERGRNHDEENREERRRKNRDRKREKYQDDPEAQAERREKYRAWKRRRNEPKPISLVAFEGANTAADAQAWLGAQARRLGVERQFITDAIRLGWTLHEVEQMTPEDAGQLSKSVYEVRRGDGFVRWDDYDPALDVGALD